MVTAYVRQQFDTSVEVAVDNASDMLATCHSLLVSTFKIKQKVSVLIVYLNGLSYAPCMVHTPQSGDQ